MRNVLLDAASGKGPLSRNRYNFGLNTHGESELAALRDAAASHHAGWHRVGAGGGKFNSIS